MNDHLFLEQFEQCTLPKEYFNHKGHLRMAWLYLCKYSYSDAVERIAKGIQKYASSIGSAHIYNENLTHTWAELVFTAIQENNAEAFDEFLSLNPELL